MISQLLLAVHVRLYGVTKVRVTESEIKAALDVTAIGVTTATVLELIPSAVAVLTGIYTLVRLYETDTCQKVLKWLSTFVKNRW